MFERFILSGDPPNLERVGEIEDLFSTLFKNMGAPPNMLSSFRAIPAFFGTGWFASLALSKRRRRYGYALCSELISVDTRKQAYQGPPCNGMNLRLLVQFDCGFQLVESA